MKKKKKEENKIYKVLKTLLLFLLFFTISAIPALIFNIDLDSLSDKDSIIYSVSCSIVFLIVIVGCYYKSLKKDFKLFFKDFGNNMEQAFKYYLVGLGVMIVSNVIINLLLSGELTDNEQTVRNYLEIAPLLMLFDISIYAPLAEELLFRKSIREVIDNKWLYIFVSGFIFGALHVIDTPFYMALLYLIPYCSLGFAFAYTYTKSNNIFSSIMMHFIHNSVTALLLIGATYL